MPKGNEYEIVQHTAMNHLELFLVELHSRNPHGHSDLEIGILLEGTVELILENCRILLQKNDIYVINRYQIHSFLHTGEKNLILAFQINAGFYSHLGSQLTRMQFGNLIRKENALYDDLFSVLMHCASAYFEEETCFELKCASLLFQALYLLTRTEDIHILSEKEQEAARSSSHRLNRITDYIAEHYTERISLEELAEMEHITACHISHFMKKRMGISFQDYLNNLRFEHAYRLLTQTSLNILDICMESGFSSSRYLNQMFEKRLGCSAAEYRRQDKKEPLLSPVLPTDNIQKRFSFHAAKLICAQYYSNVFSN